MIKKIIVIALLLNCAQVFAGAKWYTGKIDRIWPYAKDGGFILTFSSSNTSPSSIDGCKYKYAYFKPPHIESDMLKNSFAIALSAFHSGAYVGVVIDKGQDGETCYALSLIHI